MHYSKFLISLLLLFFLACKENQAPSNHLQKTHNAQESTTENADVENNKPQSPVLSCGSGCAMTYNAVQIDNFNTYIKVKFEIDTFIDTELDETQEETYYFYYGSDHQLERLTIEGSTENLLETLPADAVRSFKDFGKSLIQSEQRLSGKKAGLAALPYDRQTNPATVNYNLLDKNSIGGVSKFICDEKNPRYLPLPNTNDIGVMLVPMDCGDFEYRYYMVTVKNKTVVDNL